MDISKYLAATSPFLMIPDENVLNNIRVDLSRQEEPREITVALNLRQAMLTYGPSLMMRVEELSRAYGTKPQNVGMYMLGYDAPFAIYIAAYYAEALGVKEALRQMLRPTDLVQAQKLNNRIQDDISMYRKLFIQEPSGRLIFLHEEDHPLYNDVYYLIGVGAARYAFVSLMQWLAS